VTVVDDAALLVLEIEQALPSITGFLPLPNAVDEKCSRIVELYVANPGARAGIRSAGTPEQYRIMLVYCDRMVVLCVRRKDPNLLLESLVAHAVEDFRWDPRDNLMRLALVHHSAEKLGVDSAALFARVADMASPRAAEYLRRAPLSLASCGYSEVEGPDGFTYHRDW
jgi:hypothetical protein